MVFSHLDTFRYLTRERRERLEHEARLERLAKNARLAAQDGRTRKGRLRFTDGFARSIRRRIA